MKVIVNNYDGKKKFDRDCIKFPTRIVCDECGSELECDESDIQVGVFGAAYIKCPLCDNEIENELTSQYSININADNIIFPDHFHCTSTDTGAKDICNTETIREWIARAINYFRSNKDQFVYYTMSGNLVVYVIRDVGDKEYFIVVSDKYYETYIPFQPEDYQGDELDD